MPVRGGEPERRQLLGVRYSSGLEHGRPRVITASGAFDDFKHEISVDL
jgi:hypothetical protein